MPLRFKTRILDHLAHGTYRPSPVRELQRDLRVPGGEREVFRAAVDDLLEAGRITEDGHGRVQLPAMEGEIVGWFRLHPRGFGFVEPEHPYREGDLFVPRGNSRDAISGDRVRATVVRQAWRAKARPGRSDVVGRIAEVLERGQEQFVGVLVKRGRNWLVEPDGRSLHDPVLIRDPGAKNAKAGDKVVIELLHYPEEDYRAEGVITRVLGEAGRPDVETQAVIEAHGLRTEFPGAVLREAKQSVKDFEDESETFTKGREDLTTRLTFTIDPPDARDFDDAISIEHDEKTGEWTLGVHIADVASFVGSGGALDEEAKARGNSVYLPRHVIPMLPEILSNGVCSLQERVPRLTKSVFITFDHRGQVMGQRAASTVIESAKRLTYLEAQALIDGDQKTARRHAATEAVYTDEVLDALRRADTLARLLRKRRLRDGMIVLDLPDVELVFDDDGHVEDAVPEDDAYTHTIIEMFMVEANEAVARIFEGLMVPILRRIHPEPQFGAMEELRLYAAAVGQGLPDAPTRHDLQRLLDATRATPASRAIHFAVLRTLARASYSPATIGHFALASDHYAHFTSPIRRYPDLTVHRALAAYLEATGTGRQRGGRALEALSRRLRDDSRVPDEGELIEMGRHCSDTEREAAAAERELRDFLVMQFLHEHHLGAEFPGVITGVAGAGVFVSIQQFLVEGLIRMGDLPEAGGRTDRWQADELTGRLVARGSGRVLAIGDIVTVQISNVDLASRHLDLLLTDAPERKVTPKKPPRRQKQRGHGKGYGKGRRGGGRS